MGKHLWSKNSDDQFEDNHPGCMWGILHALDYHHWHYNVKKILPHKKHDGRRHAKGNGRRKKRLNIHDSGEMQNLLDAETSHFLVDQGTTKTSSTNKRSLKARIKSLIAEEMPKEEDHKQLGSGVRSQSRLRQTYSIHHLEPSDHGLDETSSNWNHTLLPEKCNKARETLVNQKLIKTKQLSGNASQYQFKECEDILELFKVKKELFLEILQNADDGIKDCFHSLQTSNRRTRLTKSGSFPVADLSLGRKFWPSKLEQKQNEIRSFRKGEKLLAGNQAPVLIASKFPEDLYTKSAPLMANDSGGSVLIHLHHRARTRKP
uniref:DUF3741 domain-containing protein n=1 Tax=Davidia involucrata TaxID=16924 RepID=A0A5B7AH84_DAVIN